MEGAGKAALVETACQPGASPLLEPFPPSQCIFCEFIEQSHFLTLFLVRVQRRVVREVRDVRDVRVVWVVRMVRVVHQHGPEMSCLSQFLSGLLD